MNTEQENTDLKQLVLFYESMFVGGVMALLVTVIYHFSSFFNPQTYDNTELYISDSTDSDSDSEEQEQEQEQEQKNT